uniref:Uncharacterized protein n=1 Tax=Candidatus Kentrum sp. LFY TaxID=2126342 RepID=A0A450VAE5_9GAMM|nr:MAG: hypothetical protein BECKLFY1418A_GA0070994_11593 [Candidatus Kentron sp. LFY]
MKESLVFGVRDIRIKDGIFVIDLNGFSDTDVATGGDESGCRLMMTTPAILQLHDGVSRIVAHLIEKGIVSQKTKEDTETTSDVSTSPNFDTH